MKYQALVERIQLGGITEPEPQVEGQSLGIIATLQYDTIPWVTRILGACGCNDLIG